ncbi:hypothetical protein MPF19_09540 [Polaribacter sp. Z014]|uniref:hypothetical protein n=1 Tax=unclassified Polaribacter TaxID=196858 RepID=UPI00193BE964|nr:MULTISPECIES: hypothetical protein [unclassified Polaribacter]MCL7763655.1 hypothetical protein [Polaribacter sp. Z014]QVY65322.1 hypothetical protein JOP69_16495 [Polaribacter sp. Q13]
MAKILSVKLVSIPEVIVVNDDNNDFTVLIDIEFHDIDLQLKMEYCLHLFAYEVHGELDAPLIISNWDESKVVPISKDRKDEYLGKEIKMITARSKKELFEVPMSLKLGKLTNRSSHFSKKTEVFATLAPAIGRASKWSLPFESKIEF